MVTLKKSDVVTLLKDSLTDVQLENQRLDEIDKWRRWEHPDARQPNGATREHRALMEMSKTPWLWLVVSTIAQGLAVDNYRSPDTGTAAGWRTWIGNGMDTRQASLYRDALGYGYAFATVTPGIGPDGAPMSVIRPESPRKMYALYADPAKDDWPQVAIQKIPGKSTMWRVYDEAEIHILGEEPTGITYIQSQRHDVGVCPVVRYAGQMDLEGRMVGEVEPLISTVKRINKTDYDRMIVQHFNSWKIRTIAGMQRPDDDETANAERMRLRQEDILIADDPDTKFGTLDETPLDGFIRAHETDVETMAAIGQVPTTSLSGKVANLSAEAIAELRAGLTLKTGEYQRAFGKAHNQALQIASHIEGNPVDVMAGVTWQDLQVRSLAQSADALGKLTQMLGVPPKALWRMVPGVERSDVDEWIRMADAMSTPEPPSQPQEG